MRAMLLAAAAMALANAGGTAAQETLPWGSTERPRVVTPDSGPPPGATGDPYGRGYGTTSNGEGSGRYGSRPYGSTPHGSAGRAGAAIADNPYGAPRTRPETRYGRQPYPADPYAPPPRSPAPTGGRSGPPPYQPYAPPRQAERHEKTPQDATYTIEEIRDAGHRFFGSVSAGLAKVIEYAFSRAGRPNGYILGEEAGGAYIAGLRYGEGRLYTKDAGQLKVYWQGPSLGFDFGAEGSKTMILVYNLRRPTDIYQRFGGIDGSAYVVGGVGITFQQRDDIVLAPIRSGVGLRLGANVGYLKYTRRPTWNPF